MQVFVLTLFVFGSVFVAGTIDTTAQQADRALKILKKPNAKTDGECGKTGEGRIRVRVTFGTEAKVTNVEIVDKSTCSTFDKNAVKAAYRIKFEPAIKNGEAITVTKLVEYKYEIF